MKTSDKSPSREGSARARLLSREEMSKRFANLVSPEAVSRDHLMYEKLMEYAGYQVGVKELAMLIIDGMELRVKPTFTSMELMEHAQAMLGEDPGSKALFAEYASIVVDVHNLLAKGGMN